MYANPMLEHWLGFSEGEILSSNFGLKDIFYHTDKNPYPIEPSDFEGEIILQKKVGGLVKAFINQKIIRDETGKILGCTALITAINENSIDVKKKTW